MAVPVDILHFIPELKTIGRKHLQDYCSEWSRRPIAHQYGIAQIAVDDQLMLSVNLDADRVALCGIRAFLPIDELLGYIVDRHFADSSDRRRLHADIRDIRQRWGEFNREYDVTIGRVGTLYLTCKNPACRAKIESTQQAHEGQRIEYGPIDIECLTCRKVHSYDGGDFQLKIAK